MAKICVENVNTPGNATNVDADKYHAMREALMMVVPGEPPGAPFGEISGDGERVFAGTPVSRRQNLRLVGENRSA